MGLTIFFIHASCRNRTRGHDNFGVKSCAIRVGKISREMSRGGGGGKTPPPPVGLGLKGNSTPKILLSIGQVYKKSYPLAPVIRHCEKECRVFLPILPRTGVNEGTFHDEQTVLGKVLCVFINHTFAQTTSPASYLICRVMIAYSLSIYVLNH